MLTFYLQTFRCDTIDGVAYMAADYRLTCWTTDEYNEEWTKHAVIAGVSFILYGPGVLFFQWYMLRINQASLHDDSDPGHEDALQKFGFLYESYVSTAWYWEG